jgi:hypothetical protein
MERKTVEKLEIEIEEAIANIVVTRSSNRKGAHRQRKVPPWV